METLKVDAGLNDKLVAALGLCPLFRALSSELLPQVLRAAEVVGYSSGETIVRQGEPADAFYVVAQGEAAIFSEGPQGERRELGRLPQPSSIGEVALLLGQPRTATVEAVTPLVAAKFQARAFEQMFQKIPGFGMGLSAGLALRVQQLSGAIPLPEYDVAKAPPAPETLNLLSMRFVQRHRVAPLRQDGQVLTLGFVDDPSSQTLRAVQDQLPGVDLRPVRVSAEVFDQLLQAHAGVPEWTDAGVAEPAAPPVKRSPKLDQLLERVVAEGASDLHLSPRQKPYWRIDGDMKEIADAAVLGPEEALALLDPVMEERHRVQLREELDVDLAYAVPGLARFRVNVFRQARGVAAVLRQIPGKILTSEQLGLPPVVKDLCAMPKGLILVTGPTGSGKSTTLAAMINAINQSRRGHIITIEDPIEFVHEPQSCLLSQREIGGHARSFARALRAALREDPDVLLVGEMRDSETVQLAIEAANTGHLVLATLHTNTAVSAVDRILDQFPADEQPQIRSVLGDVLRGVLAQNLCRKIGGGRALALEVLVVNHAISNLIREAKTVQIPGMMQAARGQGMTLLNDELMRLVEAKTVEMSEALAKAVDKQEFLRRFRSGVTLAENPGEPGSFRIMQVEPNSPGAEAGLARGDVILELNGKPCAHTLEQMRVVFRTDGRHSLGVERAGRKRVATLNLERQL